MGSSPLRSLPGRPAHPHFENQPRVVRVEEDERMCLYTEDLGAEMYDIAFDWRRDREADFIDTCLSTFGASPEGGSAVIDLACGSGQFLQEMQNRGWRVAGVDISGPMIDRARRRLGEHAVLQTACISRFEMEGIFAVATCWFDSLTYLLTNEDVIRHLQAVANHLYPGGLYVVDAGFGRWADLMWRQEATDWRPDF